MKKIRFKKLMENEIKIWEEFELENENFLKCRKKHKKEFKEIYNKGFNFYLEGDWEKAKELLNGAQNMLDELDNPIGKILDYINENNCVKPTNWNKGRLIYDFNM